MIIMMRGLLEASWTSVLYTKSNCAMSRLHCWQVILDVQMLFVASQQCTFLQYVLAVSVRVCIIRSVDGTIVTAYTVHECEGSTRMGARPRRYIFTGHSSGSIQVREY